MFRLKTKFSCCFLFLFLLSCSSETSLQNTGSFEVRNKVIDKKTPVDDKLASTSDRWQVADFRGLKMGKATVSDMRKVLGEPLETADLDSVGDKDSVVYHYASKEEIIGKIVVWVDKKTQTIQTIEIRPDSMSKKEVLEFFGENYVITKYVMKKCPGDPFDAGTLFEAPDGNIEVIEYRDKGIAIDLFTDNNEVQSISYISEPLGSKAKNCQ